MGDVLRRRRAAVHGAVVAGLLASGAPGAAHACRLVTYTFQPDCFRPATATACAFDAAHPDFGPQVAV